MSAQPNAAAGRVGVDAGDVTFVSAGVGPMLLFLHGWTLDHRMWAPQMAHFAPTHLVVALDRRGFGASSAPPGLAVEAEDLARVMDALGAASAAVVGMSQAGRVAIDFALRFPERVSAIVLQGAPLSGVAPGPAPEETIPIVEYAALARAGRLDEMKRRWLSHPLMHAQTEIAARAAWEMVQAYQGRDLSASSYLRDAAPQDLARIVQPALVITGVNDTPWRRRAGDALASALPNARRLELEASGHLCNLEAPDAYNASLRRFLTQA